MKNEEETKPSKDYLEILLRLQKELLVIKKDLRSEITEYRQDLDQEVRKTISKAVEHTSEFFLDKCALASLEIVKKLTAAAEMRDEATGSHIKRIGLYCQMLAEELGMSKDFIKTIYHASPLHDIGKIGIPDSILLKKGRLTPIEMEVARSHTLLGYAILKSSAFPIIQMSAEISLIHHERWDGSGYPRKLKGEEIPIEGRLVILADQYDSLRSVRPYKKNLTHNETYKIILEGDEITKPEFFDPSIIDIFKRIHNQFEDIFNDNCKIVDWFNIDIKELV